jgi:hypothetical protein
MFESQGRAHKRYKELKAQVATVTVDLHEQSRILAALSQRIELFLKEPGNRAAGRTEPPYARLKRDLENADFKNAGFMIENLFDTVVEMETLGERIKNF